MLCARSPMSSRTMMLLLRWCSLARRLAANAANYEKSRFVANVSHEIRMLLYGVLGALELLGLTELTLLRRGYLDSIESSSDLLLNVISDVLDMSRIEVIAAGVRRI